MKNKKILLLSLALLGVVGTSIGMNSYQNVVNKAEAADGDIVEKGTYFTRTTSADGLTRSWDLAYTGTSDVSITNETDEMGIILVPGTIKIKKGSGVSIKNQSTVYIPVPKIGAGRISMTTYNTSDGRKFELYVGDTVDPAGKVLWSKSNPTDDGNKGPQYFDFTESDLTLYKDNYYLKFKDNNTEMKVSSFTVALTSGNYLGKQFDVKYFESDGQTQFEELTESVLENDNPSVNPVVDDKEGFKFKGWSETINGTDPVDPTTYTVTGELSFYAIWEQVATHTVSYVDYEEAEPRVVTYNEGDTLNLAEPAERENFKFVGWYSTSTFDEESLVTEGTVVTTEMTLYAKWEATTYANVTFKVEGQEDYQTRTFTNSVLEDWPEDPTKGGYTFAGWFDEQDVKYEKDHVFEADVTLNAKFTLNPVQIYNFTDYIISGVIPGNEFNEEISIVPDVLSANPGKSNSDASAGKVDDLELSKYIQTSGLNLTLAKSAEVTVYLSQTSSQTDRYFGIKDEEGFLYTTTNLPIVKNDAKAGKPTKIVLNLAEGSYTFSPYSVNSYNITGSFNYYALKVDYTNSDTIVSDLSTLQGTKINHQTGHDSENKRAMRFVGSINNAPVENIVSIKLNIVKNDTTTLNSEVLFDDFIYTVYNKVTLNPEDLYYEVENRLYFEYIVADLETVMEGFDSITCKATIKLSSGTFVLSDTFTYASQPSTDNKDEPSSEITDGQNQDEESQEQVVE